MSARSSFVSRLLDKALGTAASATPEKLGGPEPRNRPERHLPMLQDTMAVPVKNGKPVPASPLFADANVAHARRASAWLTNRIEESKKLKPNQLISEVVNITPALAELILAEHNIGNRAIRVARVERWADTIRDGRMKLTSQGISFAREGNLNNGQHRLSAIIAAGRPVLMNVTFGEDRECFDILDTGANRTGSDALKVAGYKNTAWLAGGARLYAIIKGFGSGRNNSRTISNDVLRAVVAANPKLADSTTDANRIIHAHRCSAAAVVAALYIIESETRHEKRIDEFIDRIVDGADLKRGDPVLILRDGLARRMFGSSLFSADKAKANAAAMVQAWNLWIHGRVGSAAKLAWHPGRPFPEVE